MNKTESLNKMDTQTKTKQHDLSDKKEQKEDFETQFTEKRTVSGGFYGQKLEFADTDPKKENKESDLNLGPVLLVPGWAEDQNTFKGVMRELYNNKVRSLSLAHPRLGKDPNPSLVEGIPENTSAVELRKAEALLAVIKEADISNINAVLHSEGGINGIIAVVLNPEKFRSVTLVDPGGIIGKDNFFKLVWRFILEMEQEMARATSNPEKRKKILEIREEFFKYVTKNPLRAIKETDAIANGDITDVLKLLKNKGMGINIVSAVDDLVFPMNRIQKTVTADMVDSFYSIKGDHDELVTNPKKYIPLILNGINVLNEKKRRRLQAGAA